MSTKQQDATGTTPEEHAATDAAPAEKNRPIKTIKVGDNCSAAIWSRVITVQGKQRTVFSVSFQRSYYVEKTGKWNHSGYFNPSDMGTLMMLCVASAEEVRKLQQYAEDYHEQQEDAAAR